MTIETGPRRYPHESIPVPLIRDKRLSFRARGIAIRLLSNAPGFRMTAVDLARETPGEGRFAVLTAMKELRRYGYARVIRTQDERGRWSTITRISGWPEPECNDCTSAAEVQSPNVGVPNSGEPTFGGCTPKSSSSTKKNFQEETTTTTDALLWDALPRFSVDDQAVVAGMLQRLEADQHQVVLDELAGAIRNKAIKGQWPGWLHGVVNKALEGNFRPNHALGVQVEREQRKRSAPEARRERIGLPPRGNVASREVAEAAMAAIRQGFSSGDSV